MIIVPFDTAAVKESVQLLAVTMFNLEEGRVVFNKDLTINDTPELIVVKSGGVSCNITGCYGRVESVNGDHLQIQHLRAALCDLDNAYRNRHGVFKIHSTDSTDFSLVVETFNVKTRTLFDRRANRKPTSNFTWEVTKLDESTLQAPQNITRLTASREMGDFEIYLKHFTIIVDDAGVFKTDTVLTVVDCPTIDQYTLGDNVLPLKPMHYLGNHCVDTFIRRSLNSATTIKTTMPHCAMVCNVYAEEWDKINPVRYAQLNGMREFGAIFQALKECTDYTVMELEEIKNVACGAPQKRNDLCVSCGTLLYGDIYALEAGGVHACVCAACFTNFMSDRDIKAARIQTLRVTHPRTVNDAIDAMDIEAEAKSVIKEVAAKFSVDARLGLEAGIIETESYVGCNDVLAYLTRKFTTRKKVYVTVQ